MLRPVFFAHLLRDLSGWASQASIPVDGMETLLPCILDGRGHSIALMGVETILAIAVAQNSAFLLTHQEVPSHGSYGRFAE